MLDKPITINNQTDFNTFITTVNHHDILKYAIEHRPNSDWTVATITNTSVYIDALHEFPIGCCTSALPPAIVKNKAIVGLEKNDMGVPYTDHLCFYRCLGLARGFTDQTSRDQEAQRLADQWGREVSLATLPELERFFRVNVEVFRFDVDKECLVPAVRSPLAYPLTMFVLLHDERHFCFIKNIDQATKAFGCPTCGKLFKKVFNLDQHVPGCNGGFTKHFYDGGVYRPFSMPLETLQQYGYNVDTDFVYPYRATYDFEAYFKQNPDAAVSDKTSYVAEHIPLSVSVCSNVPGYETPQCFVNRGQPQAMVDLMGDYLTEIAEEATKRVKAHFTDIFDTLEQDKMVPQSVKTAFFSYCSRLPVIGFNSGKYDFNMAKPYMIRRFVLGDENACAIKRNNDFIAITTSDFVFLDITNFIAPGFSLANYLKAYKVTDPKGFFPYEYVTDLAKLTEEKLPPKEAFYSRLRNKGISDDDYAFCQNVWKEKGMRTLEDFLVWYNNQDVGPFLQALQTQTAFYHDCLHLDMLKEAKSIPGLTLRYLFKQIPDTVYFSLINKRNSDLHTLLRESMVGGPSIIFHRYHEKDQTRIRDGEKLVDSLTGYDCNALYLSALMKPMPTEHPIRRHADNGFTAVRSDKFGYLAREWLEWTAHTHQIEIRHKFNGREHRLGEKGIPVDGWDGRTAYQFHGCAFHGHTCHLTEDLTHHPFNPNKTLEMCREDTRKITEYLRRDLDIPVVEMWECVWNAQKAENEAIRKLIAAKQIWFKSIFKSPSEVTLPSIVAKVKSGALFGLVQCDIEVPARLRDVFSEMTPIFKNICVSRDDIGEHMREYCEMHNLLTQPRKTLVGSYSGEAILLATPLLKWYLEKGLIVTKVQQIVEYKPQACFADFGEQVTKARRQGDKNPDSSILADTFKLLGNSAYGKTLENLGRHRDVHYVEDPTKLINNPLFRKRLPIAEDVDEVEMAKAHVKWYLPLQIGYFVYQYAKLRMLEFYYDCIDKYIDRKDFQLCEMDTDSLYFVISGANIDQVIKPEKVRSFYENYTHWFPSPACDEHYQEFVTFKCNGQLWVPRSCCADRLEFDKRTPGLFKLEYQGDGMIALCSKTYYCFGGLKGPKTATKGLSKALNDLTKETYKNVLDTKTSGGGVNRGFRVHGSAVHTYEQHRASLSYLYIKRQVGPDGKTTKPLDI